MTDDRMSKARQKAIAENEAEWLQEKIRRCDVPIKSSDLSEYRRIREAYINEPQYVHALELAYRKWVLEDDSVGTSELENALADALNEAMGPTEFVRWLAEQTGDYGGPEYHD